MKMRVTVPLLPGEEMKARYVGITSSPKWKMWKEGMGKIERNISYLVSSGEELKKAKARDKRKVRVTSSSPRGKRGRWQELPLLPRGRDGCRYCGSFPRPPRLK
jgi:hypothetical protein